MIRKLLLFCSFLISTISGKTQTHLWSYYFGQDSYSMVRSMCRDKSGDLILTGNFQTTLGFNNNQTLQAVGSKDIFVVKIDPKGKVKWAKSFGSKFSEDGIGIATGPDNSIYVLGLREKELVIGADTLKSNLFQYVFKLDSNGNPVFAKPVFGQSDINTGTPSFANGGSITTDLQGNFLIGTTFFDSQTLNGKTIYSKGNQDAQVSKYNSSGQLLWVNTMGSLASDYLEGITTDANGNVYFSFSSGDQNFQLNNALPWISGRIHLFKFSPSGVFTTRLTIPFGYPSNSCNNIKYSPFTDKIYYARDFNQTNRIGDFSFKPVGNSDIFIAAMSTDLKFETVTQVGGTADDYLNNLQVGSKNIYIGGYTDGAALFQYAPINTRKEQNVLFMASLDYQLNVNWTKEFRGSDYVNTFRDIACSDTSIYVSGEYGGKFSYDNQSVSKSDLGFDEFLVSFKEESGNLPLIMGNVYKDVNLQCQKPGSLPLEDILLKLSPINIYTKSVIDGTYKFSVKPGSYTVSQILPPKKKQLVTQKCPTGSHTVNVTSDKTDLNFFNKVSDCYYLTIDIESDRRRKCARNNTLVSYANEGTAQATNVEIRVIFPPLVKPISSVPAWQSKTDSLIVISLGTLLPGAKGTIRIIDSVVCSNDDLRGVLQCTKAIITPKNTCVPLNSNWDNSDIDIQAACDDNGNVKFKVTNTGTGTTAQPSFVSISENNNSIYQDKIILLPSQQIEYSVPSTGQLFEIKATESEDHPFFDQPSRTITQCKAGLAGKAVIGYTGSGSTDNLSEQVRISCLEIRNSFDPNIKQATPAGVTNNHLIMAGEDIEYLIRFQNTGNDTAYKVVILDTLNLNLDISTLSILQASHKFSWELKGTFNPYLVFTFASINLPDSIKNVTKSQGFIKYKIKAKKSLPSGTVISNRAGIYFDYNFPIITNYVVHTITDKIPYNTERAKDVLKNNVVLSVETQETGFKNVVIAPNPSGKAFRITGLPERTMTFHLYDLNMNLVHFQQVSEGELITAYDKSSGIYFYELIGNQRVNGKIVFK